MPCQETNIPTLQQSAPTDWPLRVLLAARL
jgi:hypothetical protein